MGSNTDIVTSLYTVQDDGTKGTIMSLSLYINHNIYHFQIENISSFNLIWYIDTCSMQIMILIYTYANWFINNNQNDNKLNVIHMKYHHHYEHLQAKFHNVSSFILWMIQKVNNTLCNFKSFQIVFVELISTEKFWLWCWIIIIKLCSTIWYQTMDTLYCLKVFECSFR